MIKRQKLECIDLEYLSFILKEFDIHLIRGHLLKSKYSLSKFCLKGKWGVAAKLKSRLSVNFGQGCRNNYYFLIFLY